MKKSPAKIKRTPKTKNKSKDFDAAYPVHSDSVMFRIDESQVSTLIDLNSGKYFSLNIFGTLIWRMADGTRTALEIKAALSRHLKVTGKNSESVDEFLKDLIKMDFIILRESKVKTDSISSDFLKKIPKEMPFSRPKILSSSPEPLNVFGTPGY